MQKFDCIIVYVLEELTLGSEDRYIDYWLMINDDWWMMTDYSHIIYFQRCSSSYASFWWLITDCLHTENTKGNGGPQADFVGEQQLSALASAWWAPLSINNKRIIRQQLKEVFIKLRKFLMTDYRLSSYGKHEGERRFASGLCGWTAIVSTCFSLMSTSFY